MKSLLVVDLGTMAYGPALELQRAVAAARIDGRLAEDVLLLVEHPPVVTLGRSSKDRHLLASPELLAARGVELFEVERGGDVTFHGPRQLVGYPILHLAQHRLDLHWYLRQVEEALIRALAAYGLTGARREGYTGVWTTGKALGPSRASPGPTGDLEAREAPAGPPPRTPARKIASIGVHAKQWVTWHGFALNVATDLSYFDLIVPCGIAGVEMTSIARETGAAATVEDAARTVTGAFAEVFGLVAKAVAPENLPAVDLAAWLASRGTG